MTTIKNKAIMIAREILNYCIIAVVCFGWFGMIAFCGCADCEESKYKVLIKYCDNRPDTTIIIESVNKPRSTDIQTQDVAMPVFTVRSGFCDCTADKYINVCEIKVLQEYKSEQDKNKRNKYNRK